MKFRNLHIGWWALGLFVILFVVVVNLTEFQEYIGTIDYRIPSILRFLTSGAGYTIFISIFSVIFGFFLGTILAIVLVIRNEFYGSFVRNLVKYLLNLLKFIAQAYIDFFRSTPLLVQILIVYFGMPVIINDFIRTFNSPVFSSEVFAGIVALTLNTAAYQGEIVRSGILAIPVGQTEAARALGLTTPKTMQYIILPQALRLIIPPLTNELINVILNSSLISAIGVLELTKRSQSLQARYFLWEVFLVAAVYYFFIAYTLSKITKILERKLRIPGLGVVCD